MERFENNTGESYRSRLNRVERYRGTIMVKSPKVDPKEAAKWHGVPPTQLETPKIWRKSLFEAF